MKKKLFTAAITALALLSNVQAQTWSVSGNAGTNPATQFIGTTDSKDFKVRTNNTVRMTVKSNGKVGIGTSSPTATLQVQKSALTDVLISSTADGSYLTIDRSANGYEAVTRYTQTGVPQWKTGLTVNANGTPDYVIKNEINNSDALTIISSTNYVNVNSGNFTLNGISYLYNTANNLTIHAYAPSIASPNTPGNLLLAYPGSFQKSGNVAIGTDDASKAKLIVQGSVGQSVAMFKKSTSSAGIAIAADWPEIYFNSYYNGGVKAMQAGKGALIGCEPGAGTIYFRNTSTPAAADNDPLTLTDRMMIVGDGRVLINNNNYTSTFGVKKISTTDDCATFGGTQHYTHFMFGTTEDTYIRAGKDNSKVIIADAPGQLVGIGTQNPAYKLDVCGTMRAKEVRVATGWCDYVFADDYQLPALSDVEAFIKANKHLPDVTPGTIIESEGLEVGKTSAQMIKKIEELTLYVIDLQKQVNELKTNKK